MSRGRAFSKIHPRRARDGFKDRIDLIRSRAELLTGRDRALIQMYLDNTGTFRQMARLAGVNEANVARRIHKLVRRLLDGQYITCLHYRDKFTEEQIEMARDSLTPELVYEAILNAPAIFKVLRSRKPKSGKSERLYVIKGLTFDGIDIYTKGKLLKKERIDVFYVLISSKKSTDI